MKPTISESGQPMKSWKCCLLGCQVASVGHVFCSVHPAYHLDTAFLPIDSLLFVDTDHNYELILSEFLLTERNLVIAVTVEMLAIGMD